ncbi:hypothetical protein [Algoriella sp.]|nr:hypothetical protein [Algoriella sp.]
MSTKFKLLSSQLAFVDLSLLLVRLAAGDLCLHMVLVNYKN